MQSELVGIAHADDRAEAEMIQGLLESAGIPSVLQHLGVDGPLVGIGVLNPGGAPRRVMVSRLRADLGLVLGRHGSRFRGFPAAALGLISNIGYYKNVRLRIFPTVEAPSQARRELSSLAGDLDQHSLSDVRTVISELVAMSVANGARKPIEVSLQLGEHRLEGTVHDDGTGVRAINRQESALVLRILDGLVEEWRAEDREKQIWFRMNVRAA